MPGISEERGWGAGRWVGERGSGWVMFPPPGGGNVPPTPHACGAARSPTAHRGKMQGFGCWWVSGSSCFPAGQGLVPLCRWGCGGLQWALPPPREGVLGGWGGRRSWCVWSRAPRPGGNVQKSKAKPQCLAQALPVDAEGAAKGTNPWHGLCLGQRLLARTLAVDPYPPPPGS